MFVQAISRSTETDPNRIHKDLRAPPTAASFSGRITTLISASVFGYCLPRFTCTAARSARACVTVTPGFRRPIVANHVDSLLCA